MTLQVPSFDGLAADFACDVGVPPFDVLLKLFLTLVLQRALVTSILVLTMDHSKVGSSMVTQFYLERKLLFGLARLVDKRQFDYKLSTHCVQFVLVLSSFCPKFFTTKIFVICQVLDKNKTKVRQMTNCLSLSCFCTKYDK